jgi:hypothetical protein
MPHKDPEEKKRYNTDYMRKYRAEHPERVKATLDAYAKKNREKLRAKALAYYHANPEIARKKHLHYRQTNPNYKSAKRRAMLKYTFGISPEDYDDLLKKQNGNCAICQKKETKKNQFGLCRLAVDHCHTTGQVRGLLCAHCNNGLGRFRDDPQLLVAAANYLLKAKKKTRSQTMPLFEERA